MTKEPNNFKPVFKYFKSRHPPPLLDDVIDAENEACHDMFEEVKVDTNSSEGEDEGKSSSTSLSNEAIT